MTIGIAKHWKIRFAVIGIVIGISLIIDIFAWLAWKIDIFSEIIQFWGMLNYPASVIGCYLPRSLHGGWLWCGIFIGQCIEWGILGFILSLPISKSFVEQIGDEGIQNRKKLANRIVTGLPLMVLAFIVLMIIAPKLSMGFGSERYARKWIEQFAPIKSLTDARTKIDKSNIRDQVMVLEFTNGEWMVFVYQSSENNPLWGGTIVTKDSRGGLHTFYGGIDVVLLGGLNTLDEVYADLHSCYDKSTADYKRKHKNAP